MSLAELRALAAESYDGVRTKVWPQPQPAVGHDFTITVPSPQFWMPVALTATLVTSSASDSRIPDLTISDGTTVVARTANAQSLDPSMTGIYSWVRGWPLVGSDPDSAVVTSPFPQIILPTGWKVALATEALDTGDQWSAIAMTVVQLTGGQPATAGRRETAIREHARALYELAEGR